LVNSLTNWGAKYLNKAEDEDATAYADLKPDHVFIATPDYTHVGLALPWLKRTKIYIEKPLDRDPKRGLRLLTQLPYCDTSVLVLDQ
jgi:predicted dehydrogenase